MALSKGILSGLMFALAVLLSSPLLNAGEVEDTIAAWRDRQARVKSLRFAWEDECTDTKGSYDDFPGAVRNAGPGGPGMPPADTTYQRTGLLKMQDDCLRYEQRGPTWAMQDAAYSDTQFISSFDGSTEKSLSKYGNQSFPQGGISRETYNRNQTLLSVHPAMYFCRPLSPEIVLFDHRSLSLVSGATMVHDGVDCFLLRSPGHASTESIWVAPAQSYAIVKLTSESKGKIVYQLDIHHERDKRGDWYPASWTIAFFLSQPVVQQLTKGRCTQWVLNDPIPSQEFELEFPVGTKVHDQRTRTDHIVKEAGAKRPILRSERTARYEDLVRTEPGELNGGNRATSLWKLAAAIAVAIALAAVVVRFVRRKSTGRAS